MSSVVTLATIPRGLFGQLLVVLEPHPKSGEQIVLLKHVRADGEPGPRAPLQAAELDQVIAALQLASRTLAAKRPQHRTVSSRAELDRQLAEDRKLF